MTQAISRKFLTVEDRAIHVGYVLNKRHSNSLYPPPLSRVLSFSLASIIPPVLYTHISSTTDATQSYQMAASLNRPKSALVSLGSVNK
jgi:hypothetical protein